MKPENLFDQFQPLEGSREHQEQIERQMEKAKRNSHRFPLGRKLTYSFAVVATLVFFTLFTLGSLSWGPGTSNNGSTPGEVEYDPRLGDVTITEISLEGGNDKWTIRGNYYEKQHWFEGEDKVLELETFESGRMFIEFEGLQEDGLQVKLLQNGSIKSGTNMGIGNGRNGSMAFNLNNIDKDTHLELEVTVGEKEPERIPIELKSSKSKFNVAKDIPLSLLEDYSNGARAIEERFYVGMSAKNWVKLWQSFGGPIGDNEIEAELMYFPEEKIAGIKLGFVDVNKNDLIEVRAVSERGDELVLEEEKKVSEWTDNYTKGSLDVNSQEHFPYPGRWEIQGYVDGEQVGSVGLELVPVY